MKRREFLRVGAAGASGVLVLSGSATATLPRLLPGRPQPIALPDMNEYIARVDSGAAAISRWNPSAAAPDWEGDRPAADDLARKSLRTLYMTAMFADLPEAGRQHPGMQQRIFDAMPEMDDATAGMSTFLATRTPRQLQDLQSAVRHPSNPAMEIFDALDRGALALGVSQQRRVQTRIMTTQANWRLRNQPPALVIADTLDKVDKLAATNATAEASMDRIAGRVGEQLFWQQRDRHQRYRGGMIITPQPELPGAMSSADSVRSLRDRRLTRGGKIMGLGLIVFGVSAAATALGALPMVFVATVGAIMIIIGLLTLIVGMLTPAGIKGSR